MPLTRKQKWRIDKVQSEKIARADKASIKSESDLNVNDKEYTGKVITRYGQRQLVEAKNGEIFCLNELTLTIPCNDLYSVLFILHA